MKFSKKIDYFKIKEYIESLNYKLHSKEYNDSYSLLKLECKNGHIYNVTWNNFQQGHRCKKCYLKNLPNDKRYKTEAAKKSYRKLSRDRRHSIEFIREQFEKKGWKLLSEKYINNRQKLDVICSEGHNCKIAYDKFQAGRGCIVCKSIRMSGENHPQWKGGIACDPYCDIWVDKEYKESIKERDNYICQNEDCWGTAKRLNIHHINYNKKDCSPKNLITLCNSCNSRANHNREEWQKYYEKIIIKGGQMQDFKDRIAQELYGITITEAKEKGICLSCKEEAIPKCYSKEGKSEYLISGLCEKCFDYYI